ncbi:MAG: glutamate--tRNA ligase, partial [Acetobacteraceae bacterium]|nr:glutamate--tRNA ligase [Acetobacteraceae bacterium]
RLGWGHGDVEVVDRETAIRLFDIDGIGRAPSRMDYAKLVHLNGVWLRRADDARLTREVLARLGLPEDHPAAGRIRALMPGLKERAKTLVDLAQSAAFLARSVPLQFEPKAAALLTPENKAMLRELSGVLEATDFTAPALDAALRRFAEGHGKKLGQVAQPLRASLTGSTVSPGIDATLVALGRAEAIARIKAVAA